MKEGNLIEFKDKKKVICGVCTHITAKNIRLITENNKEINLSIDKILHVLNKTVNLNNPRIQIIEEIKEIVHQVNNLQKDINLKDIWELLKEEKQKFDLKTLSEIYFHNPSDIQTSALFRALVEDRFYFEQKSDMFFVPREEKIVNQIIYQNEKEQKQKNLHLTIINFLKQIVKNETKSFEFPEGIEKYIKMFKDLAVFGNRMEKYNETISLLEEIGLKTDHPEEQAFNLMVKLGIWDKDENLLLIEYDVPQNFSQDALKEIEDINIDIDNEYIKRIDLTDIFTFSIDDIDTADIDDAISYQKKDNGFCIGIHIADVSHFIPQKTKLDNEALKRATSLYLPDRKINMIPTKLSEDLCSLVENKERLAISILINFDSNNEIIDYKICESIIKVDKRLSYAQVDELIETEDLFNFIYSLAQYLQEKRVKNGALILDIPEIRVKVINDNGNKNIVIKKIKQDSKGQILVSEFMILANYLVAEFCEKNKIPCIFRIQESIDEEIDNTPVTYSENPILLLKQRRMLKKTDFSVTPAKHFSLGISLYTQMTSPIRRYIDLVVHRQLKSYLRKETYFYNEDELNQIILLSDQALHISNIIQRLSNRYWLLRYLEKFIGEKVEVLILEIYEDRTIVQLTDYLLEVPIYSKLDKKVGDRFEMTIVDVKPRRYHIILSEIKD